MYVYYYSGLQSNETWYEILDLYSSHLLQHHTTQHNNYWQDKAQNMLCAYVNEECSHMDDESVEPSDSLVASFEALASAPAYLAVCRETLLKTRKEVIVRRFLMALVQVSQWYLYLSIYVYMCLSIYLSIYLSISLSIYPFIHSSIHSSIYLSIQIYLNPSIHPPMHPSRSIYLSTMHLRTPICMLYVHLTLNKQTRLDHTIAAGRKRTRTSAANGYASTRPSAVYSRHHGVDTSDCGVRKRRNVTRLSTWDLSHRYMVRCWALKVFYSNIRIFNPLARWILHM
jgi:hypothetical protein